MFCYTLSARAIGATVSAGALHAQGWGFESLIAHHLNDKASSNGGLSFWAHRRGIRTRQGAELRKRASVFQRSTQGPQARSGSGRRSRTRHPSSPTTELETVLERGPFLFGPISWDSNPQGCGAEETRSVFQRSTRGPQARSGSGRRSRTRHPSSPTTELETVLERGPFLFGPISWDSNPQGCGAEETRSVFQRSTRGPQARSGSGQRNGPLANTRVQKMPNMSTATILVAGFSRPQRANRTLKRRPTAQMGRITNCNTGHLWFN